MSELSKPLPCLVCGEQSESVSETSPMQPHGGLVFDAAGAYGSQFDPMSRYHSLVIVVCDACIDAKAEEGRVSLRKGERPVAPKTTFVPYDPKQGWEA